MGATFSVVAKTETGELIVRLPPVEAYTVWAPVYDSTPNPLLALERRSLAPLLNGRTTGTIIDIGCGTGQWLAHLQQAGAHVFGLDLCEAMLNESKGRTGIAGRLIRADAHFLPVANECASVVLCSMSLGYFENPSLVFAEFMRVARPGASVVVTDVHPDAIAAGWTRSFQSGSICCQIEHFQYSVEQILFAASRAGLRLRWCSEARLGCPERPIFCKAGKPGLLDALKTTPALFLAIWEKL